MGPSKVSVRHRCITNQTNRPWLTAAISCYCPSEVWELSRRSKAILTWMAHVWLHQIVDEAGIILRLSQLEEPGGWCWLLTVSQNAYLGLCHVTWAVLWQGG